MSSSACERGINCAHCKMLDCCAQWPIWSCFLLLQWLCICSLHVQRSLRSQWDVSVKTKAAECLPKAAHNSERCFLFLTECRCYRTLNVFRLPHQTSTQEGANEASKSALNIWQFLWIFLATLPLGGIFLLQILIIIGFYIFCEVY